MEKTRLLGADIDSETAFRLGQVYTYKVPEIPEGYAYGGFRVPKYDEYYLSAPDGCLACAVTPPIKPRIIVHHTSITEKIFAISLKDMYGTESVKIPSGYEYVDFRFPKLHEDYIGIIDSKVWNLNHIWSTDGGPRVIIRKVE